MSVFINGDEGQEQADKHAGGEREGKRCSGKKENWPASVCAKVVIRNNYQQEQRKRRSGALA